MQYKSIQDMKLRLYHIFVYFGTFMVYAALHAIRSGWSYSKPAITREFDISKQYIGIVDALYLVAYSSGMAILGSFIHKFPLKYYVVVGLTISSTSFMIWMVIYSITGFYNVVIMTILMMINGFFQATGWPGIMGIFSAWFVGHKKGFLMGIWSCSANVGDIIASALLNLFEDNQVNFVWNFVLTGGIGLAVALTLLLFLKDKPDQSQLQAQMETSLIEDAKEDVNKTISDAPRETDNSLAAPQREEEERPQTTFKYGIFSALCFPHVPNYVLSYGCLKGCFYGLLFWLPTILDAKTGPIADQKGYISAMMDVGAVVGALGIGFLSDYFNKKAIFLSPCLLSCALVMFITSFALGDAAWPYYVTIFLAGACMSGPYNIIGTVIAIDIGTKLKEKGAVTKVSSLIEAFAAVFAMVEMIIIPYLSQTVVFYLFTGEMLLATVLLLPMFLEEVRAALRPTDQTLKQTE